MSIANICRAITYACAVLVACLADDNRWTAYVVLLSIAALSWFIAALCDARADRLTRAARVRIDWRKNR